MAIVDTAAQDGLVGEMALQRLKEQLSQRGLQIAHTNKSARAHGVGVQAQVVGIAAVPLGIAGTTGILEVTVVKGDVPLLLPIKLFRDSKAVVDLEQSCLHFKGIGQTVELHTMPSGHVAIDVLQFGPEGFVFLQKPSVVHFVKATFAWHLAQTTLVPCWLRGIGAFLAATSTDFNTAVSNVIRAIGRGHPHSRAPRSYEDQDGPSDRAKPLSSQARAPGGVSQSVPGHSRWKIAKELYSANDIGTKEDTGTERRRASSATDRYEEEIKQKLTNELRAEYAAAMQQFTSQHTQEQQQMVAVQHQEMTAMRKLRARRTHRMPLPWK